MMNLPRETPTDPAFEQRLVSTLVQAGLVRRRRAWPGWVAAAAAVVVLAIGVSVWRPKPTPSHGNTYALLLYVDSTYQPATKEEGAARIAELIRWADSLEAAGKFERGGHLVGPGPVGGLFLIRAVDDADAARIAATCPFTKHGGRIEVKRYEE